MSHIRSKQIRFNSPGELVIGGANGNGAYLTKGSTGTLLRVVDNNVSWSNLDILQSSTSASVVRTTVDGVSIETTGDTGLSPLLKVLGGREGDNSLAIKALSDAVEIGVETEGADLRLLAGEGGNVIIGGGGANIIEAEPDEDLTIRGGEGSGNVYLIGGTSGKVYYAGDDSNPMNELATLGTLQGSISTSQRRLQFAGNDLFTIPANAVLNSLQVFVNGVLVETAIYTIQDNVLEFIELPFDLDADDIITLSYTQMV